MATTFRDDQLYISYARADAPRVTAVVKALGQCNIRLFFDPAAAGQEASAARSLAAEQRSTGMIVFWSAAAAMSPWVEDEVRRFLAGQVGQPAPRPFVVARLDTTPLSPQFPSTVMMVELGASVDPTEAARTITSALGQAVTGGEPVRGEAEAEAAPVPPRPAAPPATQDEGPAVGSAKGVVSPAAPAPSAPAAPAPGAPSPSDSQSSRVPIQVAGAENAARANDAQASGAEGAGNGSAGQATFMAYHPKEVAPREWQPLLFYVARDTPAHQALVEARVAERLGGKRDQYRSAQAERPAQMQRGASLRIIPQAAGFQFNPPQLDVTWQEDVQAHEFRMRAETAAPGRAVNGVIQVWQGLILRAEVPFSVFVGQGRSSSGATSDGFASASARAYRHIFASYSHADTPVVESCEVASRTMGDEYLRDVTLLQSGQAWDPRLIQAINDADIFQLFWSKRAATSPFVEREWEHALRLLPARPNFIRPVYWSRTLYPAPSELSALHFQRLNLAHLGWAQTRIWWYEFRNR